MTDSQFLIAFYVLCGLSIVLLLVRLFRKRQSHQTMSHTVEQRPAEEAVRSYPQPASSSKPDAPVSWSDRTLFDQTEVSDRPEGYSHDATRRSFVAANDDFVFGRLTPTLAALLPDSAARRAETAVELQQAGYYQPHALENLAAIRYLAVMGPLLLFGTLLIVVPPRLEPLMIGCLVVFALAGWALPRLYVKGRATERKHEIEHALPDMLDMLHMCVSQGLTIQAAIKRVSQDLKKSSPALAVELSIVCEQAEIGTLGQALEHLGRRLDIPEVQAFVSMISQTERLGTSVAVALMEYSDTLRESLRQRADQKANQASFKLLFPTVLCLMPAVYTILLGPAIIELTDFFSGSGQQVLESNTQALEDYSSRNR